jgi:hypothetical protein
MQNMNVLIKQTNRKTSMLESERHYLLSSREVKQAIKLLNTHGILFLTGDEATETSVAALWLAEIFKESHAELPGVVLANRYSKPADFDKGTKEIIVFHGLADNGRFDFADFFTSALPLQELLARDKFVIFTLPLPAYEWILAHSPLGEWDAVINGHLNIDDGFQHSGLVNWYSKRVIEARRDQLMTPQQKRFLTSEYVASTITRELASPRLLEIFVRVFASDIDVRDPEFEEDFEDILFDVQNPDTQVASWYASLDRSTQVFLQTMLFLAETNQEVVWQAYLKVVEELRTFVPALAADPIGIVVQQAGAVVNDPNEPGFAEPFTKLIRQTMQENSTQFLTQIIPIFHRLALDLPKNNPVAEVTRWLKGLAYGIAQVGKQGAKVTHFFTEWLSQPEPFFKQAGAFGMGLYCFEQSQRKEIFRAVAAELCESDSRHVRESVLYMAQEVMYQSPETALELLELLVSVENDSQNLEFSILEAAVLTRRDRLGSWRIMERVAEKTAAASKASFLLVAQLTEMAAQPRFHDDVLSLIVKWAAHPVENLRWISTDFILQNSRSYEMRDVAEVVQIGYAHGSGAPFATSERINNERQADETLAVLRKVICLHDQPTNTVVAEVLRSSAVVVREKVVEVLTSWAIDVDESVRLVTPFLLQKLVEDKLPDETGQIVPFAAATELFAIVENLRQDESIEVRQALVLALPSLAVFGRSLYFDSAGNFSSDSVEAVRQGIQAALLKTYEIDPMAALRSSARFLEDDDKTVRLAGLPLLEATAVSHASEVLTSAGRLVQDPDQSLKLKLLPIIRSAAEQEPAQAIALLALMVTDTAVHEQARQQYIDVAIQHPAEVVDQTLLNASHEDLNLRLATLEAFGRFPPEFREKILTVAENGSVDPEKVIKEAVVRMLQIIYPTVPKKSAEILADMTLDNQVGANAEAVLRQLMSAHFAESQYSLEKLANLPLPEAHLIAARIANHVAVKVPVKIIPILTTLSEYPQQPVLKLVIDSVDPVAAVEPASCLYILANVISADIEETSAEAMALSNQIVQQSSAQVIPPLQKLVRDADPKVRNMAINAFGHLSPKSTKIVTEILGTVLMAEPDGINKLEGLRVLHERGEDRLIDAAKAISPLCLDYEIAEAAQRQFIHLTRIPFEQDQNIVRDLALSRNWQVKEIYQRLSWLQFAKYLQYRLLAEFQR